jgi:ribonuclease J
MARIAQDDHPQVSFSPGDRVIFSSRPIPGNEKAIMRVINGLVDRGVEVITDRNYLVHVSGHPRRGELQDMIGWVRPQALIPVHGEALHMAEHAALARRNGVGKVILARNGDLVQLAPGEPAVVDQLPAGRLYKDGALIIGAQARTVAERRRLAFNGIVSVAVTLSQRGELVTGPRIELTGVPEVDAFGTPLLEIAQDALMEAFESIPRAHRRDPDAVAEALRRAVRAAIGGAWKKRPVCHIHVLTV